MEKTIKIPWAEFVTKAINGLAASYPMIDKEATPQFKRTNGYEPDSNVYDTPEYVEIKIV